MKISDIYKWEAEQPGGEIITKGGDISGCVRFSLIPTVTGWPRHDVAGVKMIRRFSRGFVKMNKGGLQEYIHCVVCKGFRVYVKSTNGTVMVTPEDYELYL